MKVVLIEDDQYKCKHISDYLKKTFPDVELSIAKSVTSGMKRVQENNSDLILMDMSLPTYDIGSREYGGVPQGFGGVEILLDMERREIITPVIVVTQLEEFGKGADRKDLNMLIEYLENDFANVYKGLVFYRQSTDSWKNELNILMAEVKFS